MRIIAYCCALFLLTGCMRAGPVKSCTHTMDELLDKNSNKAFIVDSFAGEKIVILKDKGRDTVNAGCYSFYDNGNLKSYQFIIDEDTADYVEEYDTLGNIVTTIGNPLIQNNIKRVTRDSVLLTMYFFALNKEYHTLHVLTSDHEQYDVELKDDTSFYTNTKYASIGIHIKGATKITMVYWNTVFENTGTNKSETINDSIPVFTAHHND